MYNDVAVGVSQSIDTKECKVTGFRFLGDETVAGLSHLTVVRASFEAPTGDVFEREVVRLNDAVAMVPLHDDGTVSLVRQYRGPVDMELLEIPAGMCDVEGEAYEVAAQRELIEELGLRAESLECVYGYYTAPGFSDHFIRIFIAEGLVEVPMSRYGFEEDAMTVETIHIEDFPQLVSEGVFKDSKTVIGLQFAYQRFMNF